MIEEILQLLQLLVKQNYVVRKFMEAIFWGHCIYFFYSNQLQRYQTFTDINVVRFFFFSFFKFTQQNNCSKQFII